MNIIQEFNNRVGFGQKYFELKMILTDQELEKIVGNSGYVAEYGLFAIIPKNHRINVHQKTEFFILGEGWFTMEEMYKSNNSTLIKIADKISEKSL